ncbi:polysaccharide biosynthesis/export family protein [Rufibacter sp. XAAS-G3-1]|uniref:polysaccharide biosynthesis/export family protein n=1 Tax=Rufibacter sp. XAAS-G3-1 TaxID=2729134 RepID=UPI0015E74826|nr:polysaccharide biosynthesis/export family protein [Rufibacter sp. XAAS-G3-1]
MTKLKIIYILNLLFIISCSQRNLTYLSDIEKDEYTTEVQNRIIPRIQPDDILTITVSTMSPESNTLFNSGVMNIGSKATSTSNDNNQGYIIDANGFINFPVIGQVHLAGLTTQEANKKLTSEIGKFTKNPIVNIKFSNFNISIIGEVNKPSTYTVQAEKINIFQALALAGDLTPYGKRENISLIRENGGIKSVIKLNLNHKDILDSPYFYLQQNDILYIEPDKSKAAQTSLSRSNTQFRISAALSLISVLAIILTNF